MVEKNHKGRDVRMLCSLLSVSKSGFYAWRNREESERRKHDRLLTDAIVELHQGFRKAYGARRVHQQPKRSGLSCSVRRVSRLMKTVGIKASSRGLYTWNPGKHKFYSATGNQLGGEDPAVSVGTQWAGDFTYIKTVAGWLYHAVVIDLYTRSVVGWSFSRKRNSELTKSALKMALARQRPQAGCIFHSDQGIEYAAHEYRELVESAGMRRSMNRKGNPLDNAIVESFFHSMKTELVHQRLFENEIDAVAHIIEYIEFYNRERIHSSLGYQSPLEYEKMAA
ncbi:IS3 family transposase [Microbulbifer spongiae]|uniref:IS3 family transposase n=1 Tax=Microbulbifer spongiae TaxID=2944933 RepID=A0ABY9EIU8_9GAMM|nr:IS3 family transposase [Microbulbifer sp. MI-G]WKD51665.1 IS3 family transposase [Microbulbifer sp. MI-G]